MANNRPNDEQRRIDDGWSLSRLLPVIIVPLLTAGVTSFVTVRVLEERLEAHMAQTNKRLDRLEEYYWRQYHPPLDGESMPHGINGRQYPGGGRLR